MLFFSRSCQLIFRFCSLLGLFEYVQTTLLKLPIVKIYYLTVNFDNSCSHLGKIFYWGIPMLQLLRVPILVFILICLLICILIRLCLTILEKCHLLAPIVKRRLEQKIIIFVVFSVEPCACKLSLITGYIPLFLNSVNT